MSCILLKRTGHLNLNNVPLLAWRIPWREEPVGYSPWGHKELDMTERLHFHLSKGIIFINPNIV